MSATIGIEYTAALHQSAGIGRYVRNLTARLVSQYSQADWKLFAAGTPADTTSPFPNTDLITSPISERNHERMWYRLRLPFPIEWWTGDLDLFHATDFNLPPTKAHTKTILTIHDLAYEVYPQLTMPGMLNYLQRVVPRVVYEADHVIAVSESTMADLYNLYGVPLERMSVVPHGVEERFSPEAEPGEVSRLRESYGLSDKPIILTVGTLQPRKNHLRLVQAFKTLARDYTLVIAGGFGWDYQVVLDEVSALGIDHAVQFIGFVADEDLPALYRMATLFVFPSLYEGFGLPVLEAMACGTPVIASNTSSLPEIAGNAALLIDPLDTGALVNAMRNALDDSALRADLRRSGLAQAAYFPWDYAAQATWEIYHQLLS